MVSPSIEKTRTLVREQPGALESARAGGSVWSMWLEKDLAVAVCFALTACVIHLLFNGGYGYFRDELYYAACGQHLAWGYVDHAPLVAVIARLSRTLFGDSLRALRFFPALSSGAKILLTGWIVRELGGRRFAQVLAGTAMLLCPIYLTMDNFLSMNAFEPLFWMLCVAISLRIIRTGNDRLWIWVGSFISFLMFFPNFLWESRNHFPTIEILRNVDRIKNAHLSWLQFIAQQAFLVHPLGAPICIAGLWFFLRSREGEPFRFLGWTYCFLLAEFLILRGRIYYLAPIYPMLFAAGAVAIEAWIGNFGRNWVKIAVLAPLVFGGIVAAPLALPILPLEAAAEYANFWDVDHVQVEKEPSGKMPQMYADMMGWPQQADIVAGVFHSLSPDNQSRVAILAKNYGQAGAIDYFGPALGLPHAISGHNNYYLWGPQQYTREVVIAVGMPLEDLKPLFGQIELAATINNEYAIPEENNLPVYICRKPKMTLQQAWPRLKFYG